MKQLVYLLFGLVCASNGMFAQSSSQVVFGKNRVQYHEFEWVQYESPHFVAYWYGNGRMAGQAAAQIAENDFEEIQGLMEHRMNRKIQLLVYNDLTDLKQSNIGSEEVFTNGGGQTKLVDNKVFVYFNGDHNDLRRQIRAGIATVYLNSMMFGSNLQEIVQNAVSMNLPAWFTEGLAAYVGEAWSTADDGRLREAIRSGDYDSFDKLAAADSQLAGHSMWYFISQTYGKATVSNLLYLTRINRTIQGGFLYVLGSSYDNTAAAWLDFYRKRYEKDISTTSAQKQGRVLPIKNKLDLPLPSAKLSPDGKRLAYLTNELGRCKVYIQDIASGKRELVFKMGSRNPLQETDYNYPILAWNPNNQELAIAYEKRDIIKLRLYNTTERKTIVQDIAPIYQRVFSMDFLSPQEIVFSALINGYSDLFLYRTNTRESKRLTNDFYDDLDVAVANLHGGKGLLFVSNRLDAGLQPAALDSILPLDKMDVFYLQFNDAQNDKVPLLIRLTETPLANERNPVPLDSTYFAYISDETGIRNRFMGEIEDYIAHYNKHIYLKSGDELVLHQDSTLNLAEALVDSTKLVPVIMQRGKTHASSNYAHDIAHLHASERGGRLVETHREGKRYVSYLQPVDSAKLVTHPLPSSFSKTNMRSYGALLRKSTKKTAPPKQHGYEFVTGDEAKDNKPPRQANKTVPDSLKAAPVQRIPSGYYFQTRFEAPTTEQPTAIDSSTVVETPRTPEPDSLVLPPVGIAPQDTSHAEGPLAYRFRPTHIVPSRLKFSTNRLTTQFDNSLLFGGLDSYAGNRYENGGAGNVLNNQPMGLLLKGSVQDLFEDYELEGGVRLATNLSGAEYFAVFRDKRKQLDKYYAFYHRNRGSSLQGPPAGAPPGSYAYTYRVRNATDLASVELRYPLDIFTSLRGTFTFRNDKTHYYATESFTLKEPIYNEQRLGLKLEYVFDNTMDMSMNIKNGTRYKLSAEIVKAMNVELGQHVKVDFGKGFMTVLGLDARHYERVLKHSVFATRLAAGASFGSEKILYFLGGVDNALAPSFNEHIPVPQSDDFVYQTLASNLRGFQNNIRNGNSFALLNAELRLPVFKYLSSRPLRSRFLNNFQLVGFFDVGTAWQGKNPFSPDNPINKDYIGTTPEVVVEVNYFRDPLVAGFGGGLRSTIFGYFVRIDRAWGIETKVIQPPRWHFSLGLDF